VIGSPNCSSLQGSAVRNQAGGSRGDLAGLCAEVVEDCVDAAVLPCVSREGGLAGGGPDVCFGRLAGYEGLVTDFRVRSPSCHEREHVSFALTQVCERVVGEWCVEEFFHEGRFDDGLAVGDAS